MVFGWFDAKEEAAFGTTLAEFVVERLPPGGQSGKPVDKKRLEILQKLYLQAERFKQGHKMNVYKKAKLGNAFRWKMIDAGYDADFVDELTREVLLRL